MDSTIKRPPYDPDVAAGLTAMQGSNPVVPMSEDMIPGLRQFAKAMPPETIPTELEQREHRVPGFEGADIPVTVLAPTGRTTPGPLIFNIHGGGMIMGDSLTGISLVAPWAVAYDAVVVSVDYRLAPEHRDPIPVEDCYAALLWAAEHADELGIDPERIFLVGASAGGGLAAGVALLSRDRGGPRFVAQMLIYPMIDDRNETVSSRQFDGVGMWDRASNMTGWRALLGERAGSDQVSPYAAPARADDLSGLPPTFIDVASAEVFRDENVAYASRLWAAGGVAELHVWPGGTHGWETLVAPDHPLRVAAGAARDAFAKRYLDT